MDIPTNMYCDGCKFLRVEEHRKLGLDIRLDVFCMYGRLGHKRKVKKSWKIIKYPDCPSIRFGLHTIEELKKIDRFAHDV